jgi:phage regulator Rha-like protein
MEELTNTQLLRKIQDLTDEHERQKSLILEECKKADERINKQNKKLFQIEEKYHESMILLKNRMGTA